MAECAATIEEDDVTMPAADAATNSEGPLSEPVVGGMKRNKTVKWAGTCFI